MLLKIIINYFKPYNCVQINYPYWLEITCNHAIINIREKYMKL